MAQALDALGILHQNLIDAGCDKKTIKLCMTLASEQKQADILPLLSRHRTALMETLHAGQQQIDCLDFLVYTMQKELRAAAQQTGG